MAQHKYEVVIGLEVHAQLSTNTKLFAGDSTSFGAAPNTHVSPITLAHPGTLPTINKEVIALAIKLGIALQCDIAPQHYFARKNYFYPDLPKGYQVSQHTNPICNGGFVTINTASGEKKIQLNRIHIEEDAGKSLHDLYDTHTAIDLNRAGTPLLEIVTEPCIHSADEAFAYITALRKIVRWLNVCDGNMEEGSLRCDANISIRLKGETTLGTRVEVKNLNSIRNVKKAIEVEVDRLIGITEAGEKIMQETRSYDADNNRTFSLRSKEDADDYRYFPEPDLPAFEISTVDIEAIKKTMPMLPNAWQTHLVNTYGLSLYDAAAICIDKADAEMYERLVTLTNNYKSTANWLIGPFRNYCVDKQTNLSEFPLNETAMADIIMYTDKGLVHYNVASTKLLMAYIDHPNSNAAALAQQLQLIQENDTDALSKWVDEALAAMPDKVKEYKAGKKGLIGLFAGQVKKLSGGKADMQTVNKLIESKLSS